MSASQIKRIKTEHFLLGLAAVRRLGGGAELVVSLLNQEFAIK